MDVLWGPTAPNRFVKHNYVRFSGMRQHLLFRLSLPVQILNIVLP